jgi:hypothetical protein
VDDVRVVEDRREARLAEEELDELRLLGVLGPELLEDDLLLEAAGAALHPEVDRAHAALGQKVEDLVPVDRCRDGAFHGTP